ncbi:MAG: 30S ribosome-binding factor RbfA [Lachnospiraceae bacterium]|nr:30S ribosome-binding factor RbfA [Lachnospiraceae bacterium]
MRKGSIKNTRINSEVARTLAELIRSEIKDPRVPEFTSVTEAQVAPDLKSCRVWVSMLGDESAIEAGLEGLRSAEGFLRRELAREMNLRNTPELIFLPDNSIAYGNRMSVLIDRVSEADNESRRQRGDEDES